MKAVQFRDGDWFWTEVPEPEPQIGECRIRVTMAGICNTDLELLRGYYNFNGIPGHELVGVVDQAPGRPDLIGKRVVTDINIGCGNCEWCNRGEARHCLNRRSIGIHDWPGAFARFILAPTENVHLVPPALNDRQAVFAEPLAAALEISEQIAIDPAWNIAVLGDGKLGLLIALALHRLNPRLVLFGHHVNKMAIAAAQGVNTSPAVHHDDYKQYDLVVEATGTPQGIGQALDLVRARGTVVLKTTSHQHTELDLSRVVVNEITLLGSRCGHISRALSFLQQEQIDVLPLVDRVYPFAEFGAAIDLAQQRGSLKVLLSMD